MIAIQFSPKFEDRVSIFLKNLGLKIIGVTYDFKDTPSGCDDKKCFWVFKYQHAKQVNAILSELVEMKSIMGIDDLEFSHCYNEKEFYCQYSEYGRSIEWFKV